MASRIIEYFRESKDELKKVVWPSRRDTVRNTLVVIGISLGVALFLGAIDLLFTYGIEQIIPQ